jgi:energy-coupling factor transport system permease protein
MMLVFVVILIILSILVNPIINPRGATVLFNLTWIFGQVTMESVIYGFTAGLMISSLVMWFVSFNVVMTSDKLTYLFGGILPSSSLIFIMILRFIPRYTEQIRKISEAQQAIGKGINNGSLKVKIRNGSRILSIMFTWAMENAIQTADSMKSRGYGIKNRTSFMIYKFTSADKILLWIMIVLIGLLVYSIVQGTMGTEFFPHFDFALISGSDIDIFIMGVGCASYMILSLIPVLSDVYEAIYWNKANMEKR